MDGQKIEELDLYELLGVEVSCSVTDIKKAYRKKALQCHPDKNPDDPNAGKQFHQLSSILEILTDEAARKAYDRVLRARKEAALRRNELDGKRRKLREDLERREKHDAAKRNEKSAAELLQDEIERLRKEGSTAVQEEMDYVMNQLRTEFEKKEESWDGTKHRIKAKWTCDKKDPNNGGYTQDMLLKFFSKYGDVSALVMSPKKRGSALVEFKTKRAAEMAVQLEIGLPANPLKLEWVDKTQHTSGTYQSSTIKDSDFESVVLTRMRQAEERKRLIDQMLAEDADS